MNNETKFIITCRFPAWGEKSEYPAYRVEYIISVPNEIAYRDEEITEDPVITYFKEVYKKTIGRNEKGFDGEVLFVKESNLVILNN